MLKLTNGKRFVLRTIVIFFLWFLVLAPFVGTAWTITFYIGYFAFYIFISRNTILGDLGFYIHATGNGEKGLELCRRAYKRGTKSVKALNLLGVILMKEGKADEAIEILEKALKVSKNKLLTKYIEQNIAGCYWVKNDIDKAIELHERMMRKYTYASANLYTTVGYLYMKKNNFEKALEYTDKAIEDDADYAPAWDNYGQINYQLGEYEKAEENFLKAISYKEAMADSNYYLGCIYEQKGDIEKAKEHFEKSHKCTFSALTSVKKEDVDAKYYTYFSKDDKSASADVQGEN